MITENMAGAAAKWWADCLRAPTFKTLSDVERGDPGSAGAAMAEVLASITATAPDSEKVSLFQLALKEALLANQTATGGGIGVDYWPDGVLQGALNAAGIPITMTVLPWKTHMYFEGNTVRAAKGYGEPYQEIYKEET